MYRQIQAADGCYEHSTNDNTKVPKHKYTNLTLSVKYIHEYIHVLVNGVLFSDQVSPLHLLMWEIGACANVREIGAVLMSSLGNRSTC